IATGLLSLSKSRTFEIEFELQTKILFLVFLLTFAIFSLGSNKFHICRSHSYEFQG
ncbi:uncharacterized protein Gasu_63630, partial [Galdieria sulphuraria]